MKIRSILAYCVCAVSAGNACRAQGVMGREGVAWLDRNVVFSRLDQDNDKAVSLWEYTDGAVGRLRTAKQEEFAARDQDRDGFLSPVEFLVWSQLDGERLLATQSQMRSQQFDWADRDADGELSLEEFLEGYDSQEIRDAFARLDADSDGRLTSQEYSPGQSVEPSWSLLDHLGTIVVILDVALLLYIAWFLARRAMHKPTLDEVKDRARRRTYSPSGD